MRFNKIKIYFSFLLLLFLGASCNKDVLDRPELTKIIDTEFWKDESHLRLYAGNFYINYFVGYNSGWGVAYAPLRGYNFADDFTSTGTQAGFETTVPNGRGSSASTPDMLANYAGPNWNFYWVRNANTMIDRLENKSKELLEEEGFNHWMAVARFFRGFEYSRLVSTFGDVPYFDKPVEATDFDVQYKDRDERGFVMDQVYDDFEYVLSNMRLEDGTQQVNRYIAAGFISRLMLFEGSWQYYHGLDQARAEKYLKMAVRAAEIVMDSGKWSFGSDFKSLFASDDLSSNPEVLMHRSYSSGLSVTHHIASYSNGTESQDRGVNLDLLKEFICADGDVWQHSSVDRAESFSIRDLARTRDSRFEATFMDTVNTASSTLVYAHKFAGRDALDYIESDEPYPPKWASLTNVNDAPVMRLAEVVLNWIEAKNILAEHLGGTAIAQGDLDQSINAIRQRPLDDVAIQKGVKQTDPLLLSDLPDDPSRDADVSALMWEIRRERRMEFVYEHSRLLDLRRWKKLDYMDYSQDVDYALGPWINATRELSSRLSSSYVDVLKVVKEDGTEVTYNGDNAADMVGFYKVERFGNRVSFTERNYVAPVGLNQIQQYADLGYTLSQTTGWD